MAMTPKAIANRIKAKGLQKLRWYCEMCQKQCRDENGFKCHCMSESHQQMLLIVAEKPEDFVDQFSQEFEEAFLLNLKRRCGTKRIAANIVYNDYISDRTHRHMNSTRWETLTEFVKHLGRTGQCIVDETPKGWFIAYIDRDPVLLARQEALEKREKAELDEEERAQRHIEKQIRLAAERTTQDKSDAEVKELVKDEDTKITIAMAANASGDSDRTTVGKEAVKLTLGANPLTALASRAVEESKAKGKGDDDSRKRKSALDRIMEDDMRRKEKVVHRDYWLAEGIVVKVLNKKLGDGRYYKAKGVVDKVIDRYVAEISMIESGDRLKLDQEHLETVLPAIGGSVLLVNGPHRGSKGRLESINVDAFSASVKLADRTVNDVPYEDICKLA
eukprot:Opistho-2@94169